MTWRPRFRRRQHTPPYQPAVPGIPVALDTLRDGTRIVHSLSGVIGDSILIEQWLNGWVKNSTRDADVIRWDWPRAQKTPGDLNLDPYLTNMKTLPPLINTNACGLTLNGVGFGHEA